jgi:AcrR family transcriptional regulator
MTVRDHLDADHARRAQVVQAALAAIDELGPEVGMGPIAERAGIQRPNVYRLFRSKEQLDAEVARQAAMRLHAAVRPHFARGGTMAEIVRAVIDAGVGWACEHPQLYRFIASAHPAGGHTPPRSGWNRMLAEVLTAIEGYLASNGMRAAQVPPGVLASLMGFVDAGIVWWLDHDDEPRRDVVDRLSRHVTQILRDVAGTLGLDIPDDLVLSAPRAAG